VNAKAALASAAAQIYTLTVNGDELADLMEAVESTRNRYQELVRGSPHLQAKIERLNEV
jgi:hypothetical protein